MAGAATPALAAAVSNAGGLGSLGCAMMGADELHGTVAEMRAGTNRPFNLNFFVTPAPRTDPAVLEATRARLRPWYDRLGLGPPPDRLPELPEGFGPDRLELLLEARPAVASFHFGAPEPEAIAALKAAGVVLIATATTTAEARALEAAGMDAVIAQGWEAGGHRGSHRPTAPAEGIGTLALVPQVADAVGCPVIAAGGIADGRGIAAAFALGAAGVQIGTGFLSCPEAGTDPARRERLRGAADTDTMFTEAVSGRAARALRSRFAEEMEAHRQALPGFLQMYALSRPILEAAGDDEASFHLYGQAAALNREIPAAALVQRLAGEAAEVFARLAPTA
jgi:nitronate monooxygenase